MIDVNDRVPLYPGRVKMTPVSGQANVYDMVRADQPQKGGTPLNRNTFRKTQADIRAYPIATGNSVMAGDVVDVVNGEVTRNVVVEANVETVFQTYDTSHPYLVRLNETKSVVVYGVSTNTVVKYIDNETGAASSETQVASGNSTRYHTVTRLTDSNYVVGYSAGTGCSFRAYTNGYFGGIGAILAQSGVRVATVPLTATSFMVFSSWPDSGGLYGTVITITGSGDTSNFTYSTYSYLGGNRYGNNISATLLPDDSSGNKRVCVCFSDANDGNKGKAVIATINSSNVVTWGSVVTFNATSTLHVSCAAIGDKVAVSYVSNNVGYSKLLSINGSTISTTSPIQFSTATVTQTSTIAVSNKFVVSWGKNGGYSRILNINGSNLTSGPEYKWANNFNNTFSTVTTDTNHFMVGYCNASNGYGTSTILEVNGNQIAGGFTVNSTQAIALESGEAGQEIEVIFAGTTAADFATEGQKIPSDGVYGYGPMAGWLNVIPYWAKEAGVRIATGSYVGTGSYGQSNPNSLAIGFNAAYMAIYPNIAFSNSRNQHYGVFLPGLKKFGTTGGNSVPVFQFSTISTSNGTITWYTTVNEVYQLNTSGVVYYYIAIG